MTLTRSPSQAAENVYSESCLLRAEHGYCSRGVRFALVFGLFIGTPAAQAATNQAAKATLAAVTAAISASSDGDTVLIPSGTATWATPLSVTNAITLMGAGTNATIINGNGDVMLSVLLSSDKPVRISRIFFNNTKGGTRPTLVLNPKLTAFRVDHCKFNYGKRAIFPVGWCYGVIDHCTFENSDIAIGPAADDNFAWARPVEPGSTNSICIEDNAFIINNNAPGDPNQQIYHSDGTRTITRKNIFDGSAYTAGNSIFFDAHGNGNYYTGNNGIDTRGTILVECYSNVFHAYQTYQFSDFRGGTLFVYGNTLLYDTGPGPQLFALTDEESWQSLIFSPLRTVWPAQDQITNSYFWANTINGAPITNITLVDPRDAVFIQEGRDYWMHPPNATNVYANYTPLVYPHPMVSVQDRVAISRGVVPFASASPPSGVAPLKVSFSSAGSYARAGTALTYFWTFGDGGFSSEANPVYTYPSNGTYSAQLFVSDGLTIASAKLRIKVPGP
jgi:hypothetical protein